MSTDKIYIARDNKGVVVGWCRLCHKPRSTDTIRWVVPSALYPRPENWLADFMRMSVQLDPTKV